MVIQKKNRIIKSISVPFEYINTINEYIDDFSGYVRTCLERDFFDIEVIEKEISETKSKLLRLEKLKKEVLNFEKKLTKKEKVLLRECSEIVKNNSKYLKPQHKRFIKIACKYITEDKFKELLDKYGN